MARVDRLLRVAECLEQTKFDQDNTFDMGVYWKKSRYGCGTRACAIGCSAHLFKDEGLLLKPSYSEDCSLVPQYQAAKGLSAVGEFFELTAKETGHLFLPDYTENDYDPEAVARRIREFCDGER